MLSDEAKRQIAEAKARHRGERWMKGQGELVDGRFGAKSLGVINEITPGLEIWVHESGRRRVDDLNGGVVLAVDAGWVTDDGEIVPATFTCYDTRGRRISTVREDEVNRDAIRVPEPKELVLIVRRFCGDLCEHYRSRDPFALDSDEADRVTWAARLAAVLLGER